MSSEGVEALERELRELEEALKVIEMAPGERRLYMRYGRLMIEVTKEEAIEYIMRRLAALRSLLRKS